MKFIAHRILFFFLSMVVGSVSCKKTTKISEDVKAPISPKVSKDKNSNTVIDSPMKPENATLKIETETHKVYCNAPKEIEVGEKSQYSFYVEPAKGWKMNKEFPSKLKIAEVEGLESTQSGDIMIVESAAAFPASIKPLKALEKEIDFELRFAVCTESTCDPKMEKIRVPVLAKDKL